MKFNWGTALIPVACLAMAACDFGARAKGKDIKAPTGQVVATVDGDEITLRELRAELDGMTFPDAKTRKLAEQVALQGIINRKLAAKAAVAAELDKTPDFAVQKSRADDLLLAQALQKKIVADIPPPTREEAASYVTSHPDIFAERKIFEVDQIRMGRPTDANVMKEFEPLKTMEQIEQMLKAKKIEYRRGGSVIDAVGADPRLIDQIVKLPPDEVFVVPSGQLVLINQVKAARVSPFTGEPAITYALNLLKQQRTQETVARKMEELRKGAAGKVQFAKEYQPVKPPASPSPAPANPAAAPAAPKAT